MMRYLTSETRPLLPRYDVCIIGAGAAGMTMAWKLSTLGLSVFLAEGGGEELEDASQSLYQAEVEGDEYFDLEYARLRFFGGTTNHWGGMCRPLEAIDFKAKKGFPLTAWPIEKADLDPYQDTARAIVEIPAFPDDAPMDSDDLRRVHFVFSGAVRLAEKYGPYFKEAEGVDVMLHANAQDIRFDGQGIRSMRFENFDGVSVDVEADAYVLACGGIENSRLLLHWNRAHNDQLGNRAGNVGRYWMEHPNHTIGEVLFCEELSFADDGVYMPFSRERLYVSPTQKFMEERGLLNARLRMDRYPEIQCTPPGWLSRILGREVEEPASLAWIRSAAEQEPVRSNRVALSDSEVDRFGIPRAVLHWKRSEQDKRTLIEPALALGRYFAEKTQVRMRLDDWALSEELEFSCDGGGHCPGSYHHMGGTRMAETPETGVTDRNAMVFGTNNLFCAGSSLFPSGGHCNPTFSILQLGLRLADHLADRAGR